MNKFYNEGIDDLALNEEYEDEMLNMTELGAESSVKTALLEMALLKTILHC